MGIPGVESYIERRCRGTAFYPVDIAEMAAKRKRRRDSPSETNPILVVDLMSCLKKFYVDVAALDVICGGQNKEWLDFLSQFVARFRSLGIDLVFVNDGPTQTSKRETW